MTQEQAGAGDTPNKIFRGYDSVSRGMLPSSAVSGKYERGDGGRSVVNIRVCESVSQLSRALDIDGSLSVSYLKAANVTAKMNFVKSLDVTEKSLTIVVYAKHETGSWSLKNVFMEAKPPTNDKEAAAFVLAYGDSFVKEAAQGGEYYAVYTFRTVTEKEQTDLKGSLKTEGIYSGVTANLEVQAKLKNFTDKTSVEWTFNQEITGIENPRLPDKDELIKFALEFPSKKIDSPVTTGFAVAGYEGVPGFGNAFGKVIANRRHFLAENGPLASLSQIRAVENQIKRLKKIYACYGFTDTKLDQLRAAVNSDLAAIDKQVVAWSVDPTGDFKPLDLPSLAAGEPVLDYVAGQPASFGKEGGGTFDFMSVGDAFRNQVRIASIRLADGDFEKYRVIRRIEVEYVSEKGRWTKVHGWEGNAREQFSMEGQFPSLIKIRHGTYVDALEIHLPDGRSTSAGGGGGQLTEWRPGPGAVVLGFAGRAGSAIDQLKIIHGALKPARYAKD